MPPKQPSSSKQRTNPAHTRVSRTLAASTRVAPVVKLSFAVEPFVSVIQRHVKLSKKTREAIAQDLAEMLDNANVQLLAVDETANPAATRELDADPVLTTEEAARLVGVSRPFMVKLIDSGAVELHQKVGNQRRVRRSAVMRWQAAERTRQVQSLKRLAEDLDEEIFSS